MIIKICGIKSIEEALAALDAGADMLGFNFYPASPRCIQRGECARIMSSLRALGKKVTGVGVFVNADLRQVQETLEICALDLAQFSGNESPACLAAMNGRAFKAVRPFLIADADILAHAYALPTAPSLLVDAHVNGAYGGTGKTSNWKLAHHLAMQAPILLAGGLTPQNVGAAIQEVQPWGVDVASGVESRPGVKDLAKISAFITAARASSA